MQSGTLPSTRWAVDALAPELARLERTVIFDRILRSVWEETLLHASSSQGPRMPAASASPSLDSSTTAAVPSASSGAPITKRAMQV
jgi:hypothetical protein